MCFSPEPPTDNHPQTEYLQILAKSLADEQSDRNVRMAAGLALKNTFTAREFVRLRELQGKWLNHVDPNVKAEVKGLALRALSSSDQASAGQAAQFIASIAAIELPRNQWPELLPALVQQVGEGQDHQKQSSLATIGYICENQDADLQTSLSAYSNTILTAVVQGARKEEANDNVRNAAMVALGDSLEFVRQNMENEGERNYIMQVVCEATQASDSRIVQGAYGCLNRIMALYYDKMFFYMERALFGLTIQGMKSDNEDVAKLAIEFWCTVCEEEISIEDDNVQAAIEGAEQRQYYNFASIATQEVVPVLLEVLTKQDEDASEDDEYNAPRAAYQCLQLYAQAVGNVIVQPVLQFVEANIRSDQWNLREAAVSAFGAILEGPQDKVLDGVVKQGLPVLIGMMNDPNDLVKDSTAFALGRVSECCSSAISPQEHLPTLVTSLFRGLQSNPKMAASCCWALMNLAERFAGGYGDVENVMTPYFNDSVSALVQVTERNDAENTVRTAAYEVLNTFVTNAGNHSVGTIGQLSQVILQRLENTVSLRQQVVSVEDKLALDEMQTSLCTVLHGIVTRLEKEIAPEADRIMQLLLQLLQTIGAKSSVAESVFVAIGGLASALEEDFAKYMDHFKPYLFGALGNKEEPALCAMAIGLVSDISRSLGPQVAPYCDDFMNHLLENLRGTTLSNQFKPAILQCFGDVANAIGGEFEKYLSVVAQVLDQAASINIDTTVSFEMLDYVVSLREGIMDAWAGAILAMKGSGKRKWPPRAPLSSMRTDESTFKAQSLQPYLESIFKLLHMVFQDQNRSEGLLRSAMGVIG